MKNMSTEITHNEPVTESTNNDNCLTDDDTLMSPGEQISININSEFEIYWKILTLSTGVKYSATPRAVPLTELKTLCMFENSVPLSRSISVSQIGHAIGARKKTKSKLSL